MAITRIRYRPSGDTAAKQGWIKQSTGTQAEETKKASEATEAALDEHDQTAAATGSEVGQIAPATTTNIHSKEKLIEANKSELNMLSVNPAAGFPEGGTVVGATVHVYGKASTVNACLIKVVFARAGKTITIEGKLNSETTKWFSFGALTAGEKTTLAEILGTAGFAISAECAQTVKEATAKISTVFKWYAEVESEPGVVATAAPLVMLV